MLLLNFFPQIIQLAAMRCVLVLQGGGDGLGRILVIEFKDQESVVFDAGMDVLKHHADFEIFQPDDETVVSIPGIEIYPERRKIYQNVWGEEALGNENNAVKCHIRNLRDKLYVAVPDAPFAIRCIREVGYCLEVNPT